jgi:hypothetical protein
MSSRLRARALGSSRSGANQPIPCRSGERRRGGATDQAGPREDCSRPRGLVDARGRGRAANADDRGGDSIRIETRTSGRTSGRCRRGRAAERAADADDRGGDSIRAGRWPIRAARAGGTWTSRRLVLAASSRGGRTVSDPGAAAGDRRYRSDAGSRTRRNQNLRRDRGREAVPRTGT